MNKRLIGNLFLLALVITLGFSFIDFGKDAPSHEAIIHDFITENLEDETGYQPIFIKRIDESMLMQEPSIEVAYATVVDSINQQLQLLSGDQWPLDFKNHWAAARDYSDDLNLEKLAGYLPLDAQLKRLIRQYGTLDEELKAALYQEETRMHEAISTLNVALGKYNLSVFSMQLNEESNPVYLHRYLLIDEEGRSEFDAVFEVEREQHEVVSFNVI